MERLVSDPLACVASVNPHMLTGREVGDMKTGDHIACLSQSEEEHRMVLASFLRAGLEQNEAVLYIADTHDPELISNHLGQDCPEISEYLARGLLSIVPSNELLMQGSTLDPDNAISQFRSRMERIKDKTQRPLRLWVEMAWLHKLCPDWEKISAFVAKAADFFLHSQCLSISLFDKRHHHPAVLIEVLERYPQIILGGEVCENIYYLSPAAQLSGEAETGKLEHRLRRLIERKQAEDALQKSREQLVQAQKMKSLGTLVASVAHEINNPINLILFNLYLLKRVWEDLQPLIQERAALEPSGKLGGLTYDYLRDNLKRFISDMELAANRISRTVADLKHFSRQSGPGDKKPVDINSAVENAMRLAEGRFKKSGVALRVDLGAGIPLLDGNLQRLEQIALNLIINAIEAIDHDHGMIEVVTRYECESGRVRLSISDNGRGIDPGLSDTLFDPFVTGRQALGGTGLGLSITYNLVKAHDGEITYSTQPGKGTTFVVFLPVGSGGNILKILIADDDPLLRDMLKQAFSRKGNYMVKEAHNGIETCIKLGGFRPHLLILDICMPDMDGLEVCRIIRNDPELSGLEVIITTGYPQDPKVGKITELGFENIFFKPVELDAFLLTVENLLKSSQR